MSVSQSPENDRTKRMRAALAMPVSRSELVKILAADSVPHARANWVAFRFEEMNHQMGGFPDHFIVEWQRRLGQTWLTRRTWTEHNTGWIATHVEYQSATTVGSHGSHFQEKFFVQWVPDSTGEQCVCASLELCCQDPIGNGRWPDRFMYGSGLGGNWRHESLVNWLWNRAGGRLLGIRAEPFRRRRDRATF